MICSSIGAALWAAVVCHAAACAFRHLHCTHQIRCAIEQTMHSTGASVKQPKKRRHYNTRHMQHMYRFAFSNTTPFAAASKGIRSSMAYFLHNSCSTAPERVSARLAPHRHLPAAARSHHRGWLCPIQTADMSHTRLAVSVSQRQLAAAA
jgi:hypothetical protein